MAVRYDKKFMNEINRIINSYNRKITRLSKSDTNYMLPKKFTAEALRTLKASAVSRADVRSRLKDLQSFTAKGGEETIQVGKAMMPRYLHTNIKRYRRKLSYQTTKKLKRYETTHPISGIKKEPLTFSQYGSSEYLTLKAKRMTLLEKDFTEMTPKELEKYFNMLKANTLPKNLEVWQKNYISILEDTALSYGYDPDKLNEIVTKLNMLFPEEFDDLSYVSRNIKQVLYAYKVLEDVQTADELADIGEDVISNLDAIYENIDDIISMYV